MLVPQHMDEAGLAESRAAIAFAVTISGADEHELLPGDEFPHPRGEKIQDLPGIKGIGPIPGGIFRLQRVLAVGAGQEAGGFQFYRTTALARRVANRGRRRIVASLSSVPREARDSGRVGGSSRVLSMSPEFLPFRRSSFGRGDESSRCVTSLFPFIRHFTPSLLTLALSENGVIIQTDRAIHQAS
jgi:hypothetical protein